jgi:putative component of membrane protein insertase Oxa1/YidC/SpoIIIJ protein YidD
LARPTCTGYQDTGTGNTGTKRGMFKAFSKILQIQNTTGGKITNEKSSKEQSFHTTHKKIQKEKDS